MPVITLGRGSYNFTRGFDLAYKRGSYIRGGRGAFRTSKGNGNWFEKFGSSRNQRQNYIARLTRGKRLFVLVITEEVQSLEESRNLDSRRGYK